MICSRWINPKERLTAFVMHAFRSKDPSVKRPVPFRSTLACLIIDTPISLKVNAVLKRTESWEPAYSQAFTQRKEISKAGKGLSIKYTSRYFWPILTPLSPPATLCHKSRDPPESTSHISDPLRFLVGLGQKPSHKLPVQILSQLYTGVFVREFCQRGLLPGRCGVVFV